MILMRVRLTVPKLKTGRSVSKIGFVFFLLETPKNFQSSELQTYSEMC